MNKLTIAPTSGGLGRQPGETLELAATWWLDEISGPLEVRLFWYTRGKGTPDVGIVETQPIQVNELRGERRLKVKLPEAPYSFSGTLITLGWAVELMAGPGDNEGDVARWEFVMGPGGNEVLLGTAEVQSLGDERRDKLAARLR